MSALFNLDDFEETKTEWRIVTDWHLCGLCGGKTHWNQGGTTVGGGICDDCATIDRCDIRGDRHVSHWGIAHSEAGHSQLVAAQARRRAAFLARVVAA